MSWSIPKGSDSPAVPAAPWRNYWVWSLSCSYSSIWAIIVWRSSTFKRGGWSYRNWRVVVWSNLGCWCRSSGFEIIWSSGSTYRVAADPHRPTHTQILRWPHPPDSTTRTKRWTDSPKASKDGSWRSCNHNYKSPALLLPSHWPYLQ